MQICLATTMRPSTKKCLTVLFQVLFRVGCILILILQSSIYDYFLAKHHGAHWASWIVADFFVLVMFLAALILSFIYFRIIERGYRTSHVLLSPTSSVHRYMGELPLGYLAWGVYSAVMVSKLVIIFKTIAPYLEEKQLFGPNLLKATIALSAVVFLLLIMCSSDAPPFTERRAYIDRLIAGSTLDIVDTTEFIEVLFTEESRLLLPFNVANSILAFGCINLLLPTVALAALSHTKLGRVTWSRVVKIVHCSLFLLLIDIPFLAIRLFLWHAHQSDISSFAVKNAIMIFLAVREISALLMDTDEADGQETDRAGWRRESQKYALPMATMDTDAGGGSIALTAKQESEMPNAHV